MTKPIVAKKSAIQKSNNVYSFGDVTYGPDDLAWWQHLKFGQQKAIQKRRRTTLKRGPWSDNYYPYRDWRKQGCKLKVRYPSYKNNARYPFCAELDE